MRVSELAAQCGYEYCGPDCEVRSVRYASCAEADSIAIIRKMSEIEDTKAECILLAPMLVNTRKTLLYAVGDVGTAAVKVALTLIENGDICIAHEKEYRKKDDCYLGADVEIGEDTVLSPNVYVETGVRIGRGCYLEPNVHIGRGTVIGDGVCIGAGSSVGAKSFCHYYDDGILKRFAGLGQTVIGDHVNIGSHTTIQRGTFSDTVIGADCQIGNLIDIGHDVMIGQGCKIVSQTGIAADVRIGSYVQIFGQSGIANGIRIGDYATVYAKSLVTKNVPAHMGVSGINARKHEEELRMKAELRKDMRRR